MNKRDFWNRLLEISGVLCLVADPSIAHPQGSQAAVRQAEVKTRSSYVVEIKVPAVDVYTYASKHSERQGQVIGGQTYEALSDAGQGWIKIRTGGREGCIRTTGSTSVAEKAHETASENVKERRQVVEYAMQFVGDRYVYGGVDPNRGADYSGFTRYVLSNSTSIALPRSSKGQSSYGKQVTVEEIQPRDLLFYNSSDGINHMALYIGDGEIVHASTEKTGIKTSPYDYREPVKIVSLLSQDSKFLALRRRVSSPLDMLYLALKLLEMVFKLLKMSKGINEIWKCDIINS